MKRNIQFALTLLIAAIACRAISSEQTAQIAENAALRYWAAFSEVQDYAVTAQEAKELNAILDGTAPYDDSKYQELIKKNELALVVMSRGTSLRSCDWGTDYGLGANAPVEYARKALVLGKLNILYVFHLLKTGNLDRAVQTIVAGIRFSRDVGNGGSLFPTIVAKSLLTDHLRTITGALRLEHLTVAQRSELQIAIDESGQGLDWPMAARRDLEALRGNYTANAHTVAALDRVIDAYVSTLSHESSATKLNRALQSAPKDLTNAIPNVKNVLKQNRELAETIRQTRLALR